MFRQPASGETHSRSEPLPDNEIPPGASLELKVFEETRQDGANENGQATRPEAASQPKQLHGMGAFKGKLGGTESFLQEKQAEIKREERHY